MVVLGFGQIGLNEYEDCSEASMDSHDTLVLYGAQEECPLRGQYSSLNCHHPVLFFGCQKPYEIQLFSECHSTLKDSDAYSCVTHFRNADDHYMVVRDELSTQLQCLKFHVSSAVSLKIFDHVSCDPFSTTAALPSSVINISVTG
ncbi:unnamed protein product [Angiostrongylus costaricensis]|uniref:SUEL-type lectin domain-containing protein n=1 Tax=Angiostrongylus costaricensis TaxID=334426 RepID=A0A0R3PEL8_ANGCS|nr:unnamed protein product [Angiostrongylus costaricensis]